MASPVNLTDKDVQLLAAFIKHCSANVDWNIVINDTPDFKTAKYARDRFAILRKRLVGEGGESTTEGGGKKAGGKRKKDAEDGEEATKKKKKPAGKKAKEPTPEADGDEEEPTEAVKAEEGGGDEWA